MLVHMRSRNQAQAVQNIVLWNPGDRWRVTGPDAAGIVRVKFDKRGFEPRRYTVMEDGAAFEETDYGVFLTAYGAPYL